jgi:hypothetical protein
MRNKAMHDAHVIYGYTLKEIADQLGIHYTTVSKVVKDEGMRGTSCKGLSIKLASFSHMWRIRTLAYNGGHPEELSHETKR